MPALIVAKFLSNNERMRPGVVGSGKNRSRFVWIPAAVVNVEIKSASFSQNPCWGFVEYAGSQRIETLDMAPGCLLQRDSDEADSRIDFVRETAADLLVNTDDNAMMYHSLFRNSWSGRHPESFFIDVPRALVQNDQCRARGFSCVRQRL